MLKRKAGLCAEFYYPMRNNKGKYLEKERKKFHKELVALTGGYTLKSPASGCWKDEKGATYRDNNLVIECAGLTLAQIETLARMILKDAEQLEVYLKIDGKAYTLAE